MPDLWFGHRPPPFGHRYPPFSRRCPPPRSWVRSLAISASPGSWFGRLGPKNGPGWTKREPGNPGWMKSEPQVLLRRLVALPASGLDALPSRLRGAFLVVMLGARVVFRCDVRVTSCFATMLGSHRVPLRCSGASCSAAAARYELGCDARPTPCHAALPRCIVSAALPRRATRPLPLRCQGVLLGRSRGAVLARCPGLRGSRRGAQTRRVHVPPGRAAASKRGAQCAVHTRPTDISTKGP